MKLKIFLVLAIGIFLASFSYATEYQLIESANLRVGDIIIGPSGEEILIESIEFSKDLVQSDNEETENGPLGSLMDVLSEKVYGRKLSEKVVSGGSSLKGLSLGEYGTGIKVTGEVTLDFDEVLTPKKSFWNKLLFWRGK